MIPYSAAFRARMVGKLIGPHAISATALAAETGLDQATLSRWSTQAEWRQQALGGLRGTERASKLQSESKEVRELRRELKRKEKALAETAALLVLKRRAQEIWGDEDDDTDPKKDE